MWTNSNKYTKSTRVGLGKLKANTSWNREKDFRNSENVAHCISELWREWVAWSWVVCRRNNNNNPVLTLLSRGNLHFVWMFQIDTGPVCLWSLVEVNRRGRCEEDKGLILNLCTYTINLLRTRLVTTGAPTQVIKWNHLQSAKSYEKVFH